MGGAALTSICDFNIAIPVTMRSTITTFDNANLGVYQNANNTNYSGGTWTILTGIPSAPTIRYTHGSGVFTQGTTVFPVQSSGGTGYIGLGAEL
jgi:nickel-dependent lactate racemase